MSFLIFFLLLSLLISIAILYIYYLRKNNDEEDDDNQEESHDQNKTKKKKTTKKSTFSSTTAFNKNSTAKKKEIAATELKNHILFFGEIGGHTSAIYSVVFSNNGDFVATASNDGHIRCMPVSEIGTSLQHDLHVNSTAVITSMTFTQNSKRLIVGEGSTVKIYKVILNKEEKKLELVKEFNSGLGSINIVQVIDVEKWMAISVAGHVGDNANNSCIRVFNPKGNMISETNKIIKKSKDRKEKKIVNHNVILSTSPDDRFIAMAGVGEAEGVEDGEIGIFEISRNKDGEATGLALKFVLAGHTSDIIKIAWSANGKRAVTCCKDGYWRLWDMAVKYNDTDRPDKPRLFSGSQKLPGDKIPTCIALGSGASGAVVVVGVGRDLYYCTAASGEVLHHIENAFGANVSKLEVSADGSLVAAVVEGARRVSLWKIP